MADTFVPTADEDAKRTQLVSTAFHYLVDALAGTDTVSRVDWSTVRTDGLIGPVTNSTDVMIGANGEVLVRGQTGQYTKVGTTSAAAAGGLVLTPGMLMLGVLALFVLRTRG